MYFWVLTACLTAGIVTGSFNAFAESADSSDVQVKVTSDTGAGVQKQGSWKTVNGEKLYVLANGKYAKGWMTINGKTYYFKKGAATKGWKKISGKYYYFKKTSGVQRTKWLKIGSKKYYLDPDDNGARVTGLKQIGNYWYYFSAKGVMKTGWVKIDNEYYYFKSNGRRAHGWITVNKKRYYLKRTTGARVTGTVSIGSNDYQFSSNGVLLKKLMTRKGQWYGTDGNVLYPSTIKGLLQTALKPVGSTMYVWGGGWNLSQSGGDITARTIGVSPTWKQFYLKQTSAYDYRNTRYQIKNGLDCSGYVGWVIYNTFNRVSGHAGYVMLAQQQARTFASYGWGSYTLASNVRDFKPGDIMSLPSGHVYIVVGQCSDGSVVLLHSSPSGVMISGTYTRAGKANSKAVALAKKYMKTYYPKWYAKFPKISRNSQYLTSYNQMRWYTSTGSIITDPDGYLDMNASQVLKDLFR